MERNLVEKLLAALADTGNIYDDSLECSAKVAAAENLAVFASHLQAQSNASSRVCRGTLLADGQAVVEVSVDIDGTLIFMTPTDLDTGGRKWALRLPWGPVVGVALFVTGDAGDDERWVVSDPETFYAALLSQERHV
jgi:hypothetical protein